MQVKTKVSVTVAAGLLREVDRIAGKRGRSAVFEEALSSWLRRRRQAELDRAIESYYRSLSDAEHSEDDQWARIGEETVRRNWD
jgi:metal-responsive CopG/Arc/MetJ family transcriptional regulator